MIRLSARIRNRGEDPETLAGLVTVLRCCGLLEESLAAHERAIALDPALETSVAFTYFHRGDYARVFETYYTAYYLDAAAWASVGEKDRAASLLRTRLAQRPPGFMSNLMTSLLAVLDGQWERARQLMENVERVREPEGIFLFARHFAMLEDEEITVHMIRAARLAGFWCSYSLERDPVFATVREQAGFVAEIENAKRLELQAEQDVRQALGPALAANLFPAKSAAGSAREAKP